MKRTARLLVIVLLSQLTFSAAAVPDKPIPAELNILLDRIEIAGAKLKSFQAEMIFKQEQLLMDTVTIRNGKLYYQTNKKTVRARIHFSDFLQPDAGIQTRRTGLMMVPPAGALMQVIREVCSEMSLLILIIYVSTWEHMAAQKKLLYYLTIGHYCPM